MKSITPVLPVRFPFWLAPLGWLATAVAAAAAATAVDIGSRRELFVDGALVERLSGGAGLRLHRPVPREMAIEHDAPWEGTGSGYHSIFKDGDRYRMYYSSYELYLVELAGGAKAGATPKEPHNLCGYAESDDGIHWRKPLLGLHAFNGSKANNIVIASGRFGSVDADAAHPAVFRDDNPAAPTDARYKAILRSREPRGLLAFKSPDGLHWSPMADRPIITDGAFDSQNLAFWDAVRGEYRAYWRYFDQGTPEKPYQGVRSIRTATSKDFIHWENQRDLTYVDSPSEHLYTNQVLPYHRAPHLYIGFPTRYRERGPEDRPDAPHPASKPTPEENRARIQQWSASLRALPELRERELRAAASERYGSALSEGLLMASRDGVNFKRWNEAFLPPGIEREGTWNYGHQYLAWHVVETKSDLPGAPNELSLYAVESYWTPPGSALRRYTLRLDGFVSVQAPMSGGELLTVPVRFSGRELTLNFATSAAGSVRVEIQDEQGRPLPGFALADCPPHFGDTVERAVTWRKGRDVSSLAGQAVRLRFVLQDADVYAFRFRDPETTAGP
jgi:hypothetical protein